jgi:hypothetical protein
MKEIETVFMIGFWALLICGLLAYVAALMRWRAETLWLTAGAVAGWATGAVVVFFVVAGVGLVGPKAFRQYQSPERPWRPTQRQDGGRW